MTKVWLVSDTHFGHDACYTKFKNNLTGEPLRPWATNANEGDEIIREVWNSRVSPNDKVYHLGDVAIPRRGLKMLDGLHGRMVLIRGNHDIFKLKDYAEYFDDIRGSHKIADTILTHIPIHSDSIPTHWCRGNIHGHLHSNLVMLDDTTADPRYQNVSIEYTDRGPIEFEKVRTMLPKLESSC